MTAILDEHTQWVDTGGQPLNGGDVYIGDVGADPVANPQTVYSDRALTTVASNPQPLDSNGRTTVKLYIGGEYSIQVNDVNGAQVYQNLQAGEATADVATVALSNVVGGDTITATGVPTVLAYNDNAQFVFTAAQVNSGAVTLNIDSLGAKAVLKNHNEPLIANEIEADQLVIVAYNATDDAFELTNQNMAVQIQAAKDHSDVRYQAKAGSYTVVEADRHSLIDMTAGGTLSLSAAATLGDGFVFFVESSVVGIIPVNPNGSELIDGLEVFALVTNATVMISCDGTGWRTTLLSDSIGGRITGLGTQNGVDADHDIDIIAGSCDDDSSTPVLMVRGSNITKQIDAVWVAGSSAGGLDTGVVAADSWYHIFIIQNTVTGAVDALFSLSPTAPTLPTNYTRKRRIGSALTDVSANIIGYTQIGDDWLWDDVVEDFDAANPGTAAVSRTLSVPTGIEVLWHGAGIYVVFGTGPDSAALFSSLDVTDVAPSITNSQLVTAALAAKQIVSSEMRVLTNTSAQIRTRASHSGASDTLTGVTYGWHDTRGRVT